MLAIQLITSIMYYVIYLGKIDFVDNFAVEKLNY